MPSPTTFLFALIIVGAAAAAMLARRLERIEPAPDLLLAMRVATGVAFILAGLGNVFFMGTNGNRFFCRYRLHAYVPPPHHDRRDTRRRGVVAPVAVAHTSRRRRIDDRHVRALHTHVRSGDSLDVASAAIVMLLRLAPLALLSAKGQPFSSLRSQLTVVPIHSLGPSTSRKDRRVWSMPHRQH